MSASSSSTNTFNSRSEMIGQCANFNPCSDNSVQAETINSVQPTHERPVSSSSSSPSLSSVSTDASTKSTKSRTKASTQKAKERERKLKDDPYADVQSPYDVVCKRCGSHIKLSAKSTFDPFHWYRHKNRCARRPETTVKALREGVKGKERRKRSNLSKIETASVRNLRPRPQKEGSTESTPPLTTDESDDAHMQCESSVAPSINASSPQESGPTRPPSPSLCPSLSPSTSQFSQSQTPAPLPQTEYDPAFEEYLVRSRRRLTKDLSPFTLDNYQAWTWSQLKEPVWVLASYPHHQSQGAKPLQTKPFSVQPMEVSPPQPF